MRGEKDGARAGAQTGKGSPPLARGKGFCFAKVRRAAGITPACAGKSFSMKAAFAQAQDHPRLRGEKLCVPPVSRLPQGSPPLARGKAQFAVKAPRPGGITPACAGKRPNAMPVPAGWRDHPRLRGEKLPESCYAIVGQGSPPLARGKACLHVRRISLVRITPACAGKRSLVHSLHGWFWDHPRLRGEKIRLLSFAHRARGSPPLARGKVHRAHPQPT